MCDHQKTGEIMEIGCSGWKGVHTPAGYVRARSRVQGATQDPHDIPYAKRVLPDETISPILIS
jgi:hypothetical protein